MILVLRPWGRPHLAQIETALASKGGQHTARVAAGTDPGSQPDKSCKAPGKVVLCLQFSGWKLKSPVLTIHR